MKKILTIIIAFFIVCNVGVEICFADEENSDPLDKLIEELDTSDIDEFLHSLTDEQREIFEATNIKTLIRRIIDGGEAINTQSFVKYILNSFFGNVTSLAPFIASVLAICVIFGLINAIKGNFASKSTESVVRLACIGVVMIVTFTQIVGTVKECKSLIENLKIQMDAVFPVLLTLMAAVGRSAALPAYQPAVAILSTYAVDVVTMFALPCFLISVVFHVVGNIGDGIKISGIADFFSGAMKWVLGTAFFLFLAFLSVKGVTAMVYDSVYVRSAKMALTKYVPVIGGYLSEGYNLVLSGSVLIKNGVGLSAMIVLIVSVIPVVVHAVALIVSVKFVSAISEPLGGKEVCGIYNGLGKSLTALVAIVLGVTFLYFVFLLLVVCTCNGAV